MSYMIKGYLTINRGTDREQKIAYTTLKFLSDGTAEVEHDGVVDRFTPENGPIEIETIKEPVAVATEVKNPEYTWGK